MTTYHALSSRWRTLSPRFKRTIITIASMIAFGIIVYAAYHYCLEREIAFKKERYGDHRGGEYLTYIDTAAVWLRTLLMVAAWALASLFATATVGMIKGFNDRLKRQAWSLALALTALPLAFSVTLFIFVDNLV